jgi:hypothetical protein
MAGCGTISPNLEISQKIVKKITLFSLMML